MRIIILCVLVVAGMVIQPPVPRFAPLETESLTATGTFVNAFADYDADGDLDLFVGFGNAPNRLYRNDGGTFVDVARNAGVADERPTRAAAWGDFDADGDPDLLVGFTPADSSVLRLYRNDKGQFVDITTSAGLTIGTGAVRQPCWIDTDGDGDLDLFIAFRDRANALFENERNRFVDVAASVGLADTRRSVGAVWFDYDEDGDLDVYVGNMDGDANGLYQNTGGKFLDVAERTGLAWAGRAPRAAANGTVRPCVGDVDNDGRLDLIAANYGPLGFFLNRGGGRFEDVTSAWGLAIDSRYDTCALSDFDHDGRVDLYVNGTVTGGVSYRDYLFRNTGTRFDDVTPAVLRDLHADHGVQWGDIDGDGDEDLSLTGVRTDPVPLLIHNQLPQQHARRSISVRVLDARGRATRAGAEVRLFRAGSRHLLATRIIDTGSGYDAQSDVPAHIGLAEIVPADIEVTFPARGRRAVARMRNVDPRRQRQIAVRVP